MGVCRVRLESADHSVCDAWKSIGFDDFGDQIETWWRIVLNVHWISPSTQTAHSGNWRQDLILIDLNGTSGVQRVVRARQSGQLYDGSGDGVFRVMCAFRVRGWFQIGGTRELGWWARRAC